MQLFLSTEPTAAERPTKSTKSFVLLGEFQKILPREDALHNELVLNNIELPSQFHKNVTVFLHVIVQRSDVGDAVRWEAVELSRFILQQERRERRSYLLAWNESTLLEEKDQPKAIASIPRVIEVGLVQELRQLSLEGLVDRGLGDKVEEAARIVRLPLYVNTISPRDEYQQLDQPLSLELRFRNVGLGYWTMLSQINQAFDQAETLYGANAYDVDSFKQMVGGSSPWKILLVYSVAILHLVFEYLALSADVSFWRSKTSFEGMSSSSVGLQACTTLLMFLYVQEQQQTKFVLYMIGFRLSVQLWKLAKLTKVEFKATPPFFRWLRRTNGGGGLEELQDIQEAEALCMRWLMIVLLPAIAAFCSYRLVTQKFRSWYSWLVLSLAICSQIGGFVIMTPQVFLNYRLKSVEHLPWRALTYQAINTFIDDLFVLCIRMPEVQKYSVFRDDIIFLICLVQRFLYAKRRSDEPEQATATAVDKEKTL